MKNEVIIYLMRLNMGEKLNKYRFHVILKIGSTYLDIGFSWVINQICEYTAYLSSPDNYFSSTGITDSFFINNYNRWLFHRQL